MEDMCQDGRGDEGGREVLLTIKKCSWSRSTLKKKRARGVGCPGERQPRFLCLFRVVPYFSRFGIRRAEAYVD